MGKRSGEDSQKSGKKVKTGQAVEKEEEGFSLFSGRGDADLDDVFSKGATFAVVPGVGKAAAGGSLLQPARADEIAEEEDEEAEDGSEDEAEGSMAETSDEDGDAEEADFTGDNGEDNKLEAEESRADSDDEDAASVASSSSSGSQELVHESVKAGKGRDQLAKRYVPPGETPEDRDRRTVFLGNLPIECATSKSSLSHLRQHLLTFCSGAKIESVRFRSVPFATPTTARPLAEKDKAGKDQASSNPSNSRQEREKQRAAAWRGEAGAETGPGAEKVFLDSKGKRKVAFIKKEFHASAKTCNAYVVFAHPSPDRSTNVAPILDPYEAAERALNADGSNFMDHLIRVDRVNGKKHSAAPGKTAKQNDWLGGADPRLSIFVGGLDYETKEDDLRSYFESLMVKERGEREKKYVTGVRLIRDRDTQMGKGFGYVHFAESESVDEVLAIDQRLKFAKRPIRVQRCKASQSHKIARQPVNTKQDSKPTSSKARPTGSITSVTARSPKARNSSSDAPRVIPKGDPKLGERLKGLSKDERKAAKASDAHRQARRMAKKKLKHRSESERSTGAVKLGGKDNRPKGHGGKAKKGRVRSEHALNKMKGART
ncbi:hypothetical protein BD324DRAFT_629236 [Kockovaella imperatae]|uniref:Nucleolar protein 12 n=1 Tax=Kockovaella imperatae TaxID=4999 RepID=A0A1Y1UES7_9TREE|nr:hypothetical protein BD324DRAFT_629236 [Kockovaella imperatae]ORX36528.1 hypothetical protein BD324DRAFT_629236 [Kockovaella imperatae]